MSALLKMLKLGRSTKYLLMLTMCTFGQKRDSIINMWYDMQNTFISSKIFSVDISLVNILKFMKTKQTQRNIYHKKGEIVDIFSSCRKNHIVIDHQFCYRLQCQPINDFTSSGYCHSYSTSHNSAEICYNQKKS